MNPKFRPQSDSIDETATGGILARLKRWTAVLAVAALAASGALLATAPASADDAMTGNITGTIHVMDSDGFTQTPGFGEITITAWRLLPGAGEFGLDDAVAEGSASNYDDGGAGWHIGQLPVGTYAIEYSYSGPVAGVVDGFAHGAIDVDEALNIQNDFVAIGDGASHNFNDTLSQGGKLSGTVTNGASVPLAGQPVNIWRLSVGAGGRGEFDLVRELTTDAAGHYAADTLRPGPYAVQSGGVNDYVKQFSDGSYGNDPYDTEWLQLGYFDFDETVNLTLSKGSNVSGTVTSTSGAKLSGIDVSIYEYEYEYEGYPEYGGYAGDLIGTVTTNSAGAYKLPALSSGLYAVGFDSSDLTVKPYLSEFWNNKTRDTATPITLNGTSAKPGVNASLAKAAKITGTIAYDGGIPLESQVSVTACRFFPGDDYSECGQESRSTYNEATGAYELLGLAAGSYTVFVDSHDTIFRDEYYSNAWVDAAATRFAVATGAKVTGKNFTLDAGASITGYVTNSVDGLGVENAYIEVYPTAGNAAGDGPIATTMTDEDGHYSLFGLNPGSVALHVDPSESGFAGEWYDGSLSSSHITPVELTVGVNASAHFVVEPTQDINGTVRAAADSSPIPYASVSLYRFRSSSSVAPEWVDYTEADEFGAYEFSGVAPGQYVLRASADEYITTWANAQWDEAVGNAQRLTVTESAGTAFDPYLRRGAALTGRIVTDAGPVDEAWVSLDCWDTDSGDEMETESDGVFSFSGIIPGDCSLRVTTYEAGYVAETEFPVPALSLDAATTDLGDLHVAASSVIEGTVRGPTGKPAAGVGIISYIENADGLPVPTGEFTVTDSHGGYALQMLPVGTIYLQFLSDKYPIQYLGGGTEWSQSETIEIATQGSVVHRDVSLFDGGRITGVIRNAVTGKAMKGVVVDAYPLEDEISMSHWGGGSAVTNSKGVYTIGGLAAGSYDVEVNTDWASDSIGLGYTTATQTVHLPSRGVKTVSAKLTPTLKVSGTVRDELGSPLWGVDVEAYRWVNGERVEAKSNASYDWTGGNGSYELRLEPGSWILHFSDSQNRVAEAYYGGGQEQLDSTRIVLAKSSVTKRDVVMPRLAGGITGHFEGEYETPSGHVTLSRLDGAGEPVWSRSLSDWDELVDVNDVFPIENLAPGTYRLRVDPYGGLGHFGFSYAPKVVDDIVVVDGELTDLGVQIVTGFEELSYSGYPMVDPANPPIIVPGGMRVGDTLYAQAGLWNQIPTATYYQWMRDGRPIPGAVHDTYVLTPGDAGHHIRLATGISSQAYPDDYPYQYFTDETDVVEPGCAPDAVVEPTVTGSPNVGKTLTANPGTWSRPGVQFSYRWIRTSVGVDAVTVGRAASYTATAADLWSPTSDTLLSLEVTASQTGYDSAVRVVNVPAILPAAGAKVVTKGVVSSPASGVYQVTAGTWSTTGLTFEYLWKVHNADGSTSSFLGSETGALSTAGFGGDEWIEVTITGHKAGYYSTSYTLTVRKGPQVVISGTPQLSAVPQVGLPVAVDLSGVTFSVTDTTLAYQWYRDSTAISGAKAASYTPLPADAGKTLSVKVIASATGYPSSIATTVTATGVTLAAGTITPDTVWISGPAAVGRTLTAEPGTWSPAPTSWAYQWKRDGVAITGATSKTYVVAAKDLGKVITVDVTGKRSGFANVKVTSDATPPVVALPLQNLESPTIPSIIRVGQKVTAGTGKWDLKPSAYAYQWTVNGVPIPGATASTYTPTASDVGLGIGVRVTAKRSGYGNSDPACSNSVFVDLGAAVSATAKPVLKVNGTTVTKTLLGKVVTTTTGTWPGAGLSLSYQWQVLIGGVWIDLPGETHNSLYLDGSIPEAFQAGYSYRAVVTAERTGYLPSAPIASAPVLVTG